MSDATKVSIRDMTHVEFAQRMQRPCVILIPLDSQEEQGPHSPMGDYRLTEALVELSAREGDGLVAPILPFGYAEFFHSMAGGMQLRVETFCAVLEDMLGAYLDHGHGGGPLTSASHAARSGPCGRTTRYGFRSVHRECFRRTFRGPARANAAGLP